MEYLVTILVSVFGSNLINMVLSRRWKKKDEKEGIQKMQKDLEDISNTMGPLKTGVMAILHESLLDKFEKWSKKGYFPRTERDRTETPMKAYKQLGGDGAVDMAYDKCLDLPFTKSREETA